MFNIFKKEETEKENNHPSITAVACLLIHSARIDENYTDKEKKIIKEAIIEMGGETKNIDKIMDDTVIENNGSSIETYSVESSTDGLSNVWSATPTSATVSNVLPTYNASTTIVVHLAETATPADNGMFTLFVNETDGVSSSSIDVYVSVAIVYHPSIDANSVGDNGLLAMQPGQSVDLDPILDLADTYKLFVIEDAAQAHGAVYKSKKLGCHGDVVAWSFYPGKNLGAFGDAGGITTNRDDLAEKIRILGNYGSKKKYVHNVIGLNSRLDPIQATILDVKLKHLDEWNSRRVKVAQKYLMELENFDLKLPSEFNLKDSVWHIFPIRVQNRDELSKKLAHDNIETLVHYPVPPYLQKAYKDDFQGFQCIRTEEITSQLLSLPIGPHLTEQEVDFVIERVRHYCS